VLAAAQVLGTDRLARILEYLDETLVAGHPDLRMADMEETIGLAGLLDPVPLPLLDRLAYAIAPVDSRDPLAVEMLLAWARQHAARGWVEQPAFGANADLLKLEARVRIVTTWLWLGQRYPEVFEGAEEVTDLRADLNARIEQKLVASSVARGREGRGGRGGRERAGERSRRRERRGAGRER
jgi:ATP-dependent RNA helicase SUPV3L1/SUV3